MINFYFTFIIVNIIFFVVIFAFGNFEFLINTQISALGSLITTLGSYKGYKKQIEKRSKEIAPSDIVIEDADVIDIIEDPYNLYDDEDIDTRDPDTIDLKEFVKEEKKRLKQTKDWGEIIRSMRASLSIFRVVGYLVIIYSFFALLEKEIFSPLGFLLGLSIVPISALLSAKKIHNS